MSELESKIIELRKDGLSYGAIQKRLGNPSKNKIKETLKLYAPELLGDVVENYNKLRPKYQRYMECDKWKPVVASSMISRMYSIPESPFLQWAFLLKIIKINKYDN